MQMQTEIEFTLPRGYVDGLNRVHRSGRMRVATVMDEVELHTHPKAQANEAYLPVLLLSRVITHLGSLPQVTTSVIEGLFAADMAYLEDLYLRLNSPERLVLDVTCPCCQTLLQVAVAPLT